MIKFRTVTDGIQFKNQWTDGRPSSSLFVFWGKPKKPKEPKWRDCYKYSWREISPADYHRDFEYSYNIEKFDTFKEAEEKRRQMEAFSEKEALRHDWEEVK